MTKIITTTVLSFLLSSCAVYKIDVQQGNAVSQEAVTQLRKGMSKGEVASLLGNSLMQDNFRSDRWDYIYYTGRGTTSSKQQNLTVKFSNGQLVQVTQ
ncbi:MAG: outer membrane protein assembly factor BamE [Cocleimonas sp.]